MGQPCPYHGFDSTVFFLLLFMHDLHLSLSFVQRLESPAQTRRREGKMYFNQAEFGKRLQECRKSRGITQEALADLLGFASKQHVSRMERGVESCSLDVLVELSGLLHVSTDYLLMGTNPDKEITKAQLISAISQLTDIADQL